MEFPPTSAEWTFFVAAAVILIGPLLVERIGLPGIVGVILGGLLVGSFVLGALDERRGAAERELAVAVAGIAAAGVRGRALVVGPHEETAREVAELVGEDAEVVVDGRSRREAVAAVAREDDLVLVPRARGRRH